MKQFIISLSLTIFISTAAFSQIQVDSIGNVGIGTVNPLVHLEVHEITPGDSIATMRIYQHNCGPICGQTTGKALQLVNSNITGVYNGARLSFADPVNVINNDEGAASIHLVNRVSAIGYGGLAFSTRNSTGFGERMRLDTAGNVGIGTVSPTQKIDINGKLRVRDVTNDNTKDSVLVVSGDGTVSYRDASTITGGVTTYSIGDFAHGGIVFWVDETGQHGLVCAKSDQSSAMRWYAGTNGNTQAKGDGPFSGEANTSIIISSQVAIGDDNGNYAARLCNELQITEGGYTYGDWYLPSSYELNLMYVNRAAINATATVNGGVAFATSLYWSSTELDNLSAWYQFFSNGLQTSTSKNFPGHVRAVRAF